MHAPEKVRSHPVRNEEQAKARSTTLRDVDRALLRDLFHVLLQPASAGAACPRR